MPKVSRNKRTITRDSVFRHTGTQDTAPQGIKPEAAPTHQTAVWLGDEEVEWLDSRCREIRKSGWRSITRSAFIRALSVLLWSSKQTLLVFQEKMSLPNASAPANDTLIL